MAVKLILSTCGCSSLIYDAQYVIDSNYLPTTDINIGWLEFDGDRIQINETFASITALLGYLNGSFKTDNDKAGSFFLEGDVIFYNNPEGYLNIEIMAILQNYLLIFVMGTVAPELLPNKDYITVANGASITDASLDGEILTVTIGTTNTQPLDQDGWSQAGTNLTFNGPNQVVEDTVIYVLIKQIPA